MNINKYFLTIIFTITLLGFILRFYQYDTISNETESFDEVFYAWGGASLIQEGIPTSWSWFEQYTNEYLREEYGTIFRIVSPVIEKPPLYFIINGLLINFAGPDNYFKTPHSLFRIIPLLLSIATIFLTGLLASKIFNKQIGLLSALLYATIPNIILANRLSLTENLITPIILLSLYLFSTDSVHKITTKTYAIGFLSAAALLTKQVGIIVALSFISIYLYLRLLRKAFIISLFLAIALISYITYAAYYDWNLFLQLNNQWRIAHTLAGLPEVISSIFRYPGFGPKNHPYLDGTMLAAILILFTAPFWIINNTKNKLQSLFLYVPFLYLILISLNESGSTPFTYFNWYIYPLFPFAIILLAKIFSDFYKKPNILYLMFFQLLIGSSIVRNTFITFPRIYHYLWQYTFIILLITGFSIFFLKREISKTIIIILFSLLILSNIYTVINIEKIYRYGIVHSDLSLFNV